MVEEFLNWEINSKSSQRLKNFKFFVNSGYFTLSVFLLQDRVTRGLIDSNEP